MEYINFLWMDYALFVAMFGLSVLVGIYFGCCRKPDTTSDYLHGGKKMQVFPVTMSLVASSVSGIGVLGIPAEVYMYGTQYWIMTLSLVFVGCITYMIFLPVFYKLQLTSIFEYLEFRYDKSLRTVISALFGIHSIIVLPIVIYASSLAFNQVTGFNTYIIATVMSLICIFYTTMGGVKAVIWADTLQFAITFCTLLYVMIRGTMLVGGALNVWETAKDGNRIEFFNMNVDPTVRNTFWTVLIGNVALWTFMVGTNQSTVQRFLAVPTYGDAKKVLLLYVIITVISKSVSCFSGLIAYAKYHDCDPLTAGFIRKPDQILPYFVSDVAAEIPGLSGLFICGLFTTALSTLSTYLNSVSATLYTDMVSLFMPADISERTASTLLKLITLIVGLICLGFVFVVEQLGTILQMGYSFSGAIGGPTLGLYFMGMLFPGVNKKGAFYGVISSTLIMIILLVGNQFVIWKGLYRITPKPLTTYGCNASTTTSSLWNSMSSTTAEILEVSGNVSDKLDENKPFWLFTISFHYYTLVGFLLTISVGILASWITKQDDEPEVHPDLLCLHVRRFFRDRSSSSNTLCVSEKKAGDITTKENCKEFDVCNILLKK